MERYFVGSYGSRDTYPYPTQCLHCSCGIGELSEEEVERYKQQSGIEEYGSYFILYGENSLDSDNKKSEHRKALEMFTYEFGRRADVDLQHIKMILMFVYRAKEMGLGNPEPAHVKAYEDIIAEAHAPTREFYLSYCGWKMDRNGEVGPYAVYCVDIGYLNAHALRYLALRYEIEYYDPWELRWHPVQGSSLEETRNGDSVEEYVSFYEIRPRKAFSWFVFFGNEEAKKNFEKAKANLCREDGSGFERDVVRRMLKIKDTAEWLNNMPNPAAVEATPDASDVDGISDNVGGEAKDIDRNGVMQKNESPTAKTASEPSLADYPRITQSAPDISVPILAPRIKKKKESADKTTFTKEEFKEYLDSPLVNASDRMVLENEDSLAQKIANEMRKEPIPVCVIPPQKSTPPAPDETKGRWVSGNDFLCLKSIENRTLQDWRYKGAKADDGMSGIDSQGNQWRKKNGKQNEMPEYFVWND